MLQTICEQNPELTLKTAEITTKLITKNKRNARNLIIEVDTQTLSNETKPTKNGVENMSHRRLLNGDQVFQM